MPRKPFLLITPLLLAACAVPPRLGPAPALRTPDSIAASHSLAGNPAGSWPAADWWAGWGDPQLGALVAEALAANPDMALASARLAAADAAARQSRAGLRPALSANASLGGQQLSRNLGIPPQFVPAGVLESGLVNLQAGWNLDLWGQGKAALRAARREADALAVERDSARLMLAAGVAQAYADLAATLDRQAVAADALAIRRQTLDLTAGRVAAGLDNDGARAQAASRLALASADASAAAQQVAVARHRLALLLGAGPDRGLAIAAPAIRPLPPGLPADVRLNLIARRPDVQAAALRVAAAGERETAARRAFLPNLSLNATIGQQSLGFGQLVDSGSLYAQFGPALNLPLLDGGRRAADLQGGRANRQAAIAAHDATLLRAVAEVADAASAVLALGEQQAAARTALDEAQAARRVAALRYQAGLSNQIAVLIADDAVVGARRALADVTAFRLAADVALVRALGGGFRQQERG
ncbi:MAG: efflux transporter outer membrane subunit [Alphaproteobacteria bacterium]|nr:efflux transporter outer membrane subunit [Alphaproteobacteria bacterium]